MNTNPVFSDEILKLRTVIFRRSIYHLLVNTFLLALIFNLLALGIQKTGLFSWKGYSIYPLLVLAGFAFALLYALKKKKSFMAELNRIDAHLDMKDCLSTAYEYYQRRPESVFAEHLFRNAACKLNMTDKKQIFPLKFSLIHSLILIFSAAICILLFLDFTPIIRQKSTDSDKYRQVKARLRHFSDQALADLQNKDKAGKDLYQQMQNLAQSVDKGAITEKKLADSVQTLTDAAQAEQKKLVQKLAADPFLKNYSDMPIFHSQEKENIKSDDLRQFMNQLQAELQTDIPDSVAKSLSDPDQIQQLAELMDELADQLTDQTGDISNRDQHASGQGEKKNILALKKPDKNNEKNKKDQSAMSEKTNSFNIIPPGFGNSRQGSEKNDSSAGSGRTGTAGQAESTGKTKRSSKLAKSKGPLLKEKGVISKGDQYAVHIRALPVPGKGVQEQENVFRPYKQEMESILKKEDIPLNYRNYIKNYFLSVGIGDKK
ncbi:MAG: hypothetical protein GY795_29110 [Desulfobacterales bacterium]|nr:hypothetical protein [Desulfobacterales bacterium]